MGKNKGPKAIGSPTFTVMVGGIDVTMTYGIISFMINRRVNRVSVAELVLYDGSAATGKFAQSDKPDFIPGATVIIKGGYKKDQQVIFEGIIIKHSIKAPLNAPSTLILEIRDKCVKMTINRKNKYYSNALDSTIISAIAGENGVSGKVDPTEALHKEMVQYYCTDWDFVVSRAEANGLLVIPDDGKLNVQKPVFVLNDKSLDLKYGDQIIDFEAEMDARQDYGDVTAQNWDYTKQDVAEIKAVPPVMVEEGNISGKKESEVLGVSNYLLQHPGKMENPELTAWANSKLLRSRMAKIKGRVRIFGNNVVKPGDMVLLQGVGDRFNGPAYVSGVLHSYSINSTWYTDILFGLGQEWFYEQYDTIKDQPASGLLPAVNGLVTGIVTDIVDDPPVGDGEYRVRVRIPLIDKGEKGVWARIVSADAGDERGILIRPEEGDEVILGFVNDDPRDPIILGMLYSSKKKVPSELKPDKKNKMKGWITKSKIKFLIDDDKKIVTIETPGKNTIIIDDDKKSITLEDQNKNKIVMDDKGVLIDTPKDFVVNAKGKVTITGTKDVKLESKSGKFAAKGTSGAEVSSSGQTEIKGSLLKLN